MYQFMRKDWRAQLSLFIFLVLSGWWTYNNYVVGNHNVQYDSFFDFGEVYGYLAVCGGIWGLIISKRWGGIRSVMGKAIIMFSLGLFAQEFGQLSYAFYNDIYKTPGPYPSMGDIGFFGSIPLYIYGILLLAKASGVKIKLQSYRRKIQAIFIPIIMLVIGYILFLQGYKFDWSDPIKVFLDFGYPLGQAIYVSIALLTYFLSKGILGGVMKNRILFIVFALVIQFLSDYIFLYQSSRGLYQVGGINDYMYLVAYFVMTLALLGLNVKSINKHLD
jgi:hypothetical protein